MHENKSMTIEDAVDRYLATVLKIAYTYTKNTHDAEDIAQDVFLALCSNFHKLKSDEHIKAWLIRVTINKAKNYMRSWHIAKRSSVVIGNEICAHTNNTDSLLDSVLELDEKYRLPIHLMYYEGYSIKEIAEILDENPATIGTRLKRGRELLKKMLGDDYFA